MRFVALALTILLAAGCQALYLYADIPDESERIMFAILTSLSEVKETTQKAIDGLDDAEFKEIKVSLTLSLNRIQGYLVDDSVSIYLRASVGLPLKQYISDTRAKVEKDIEDLRRELEPKREELRQVLKKHFDEYHEKLEPLIKEYLEKNRQQMEQLRVKVEPVMKELHEKIKTNVEETESKLTPIVEVLRNKLTERLEQLRAQVEPYVQEYREQAKTTFEDVWAKYESGDLQKKLQTMSEELRSQLFGVWRTIQKVFQH